MKTHPACRVVLFFVLISFPITALSTGPTDEIQKILEAQAAAWNAHDIEGFMASYWKSEDVTFQSGGNRYRGWQTMLDRYKTNYAGEYWGILTFSDLEIEILAPDAAYVLGRWKVEAREKPGQGVFTIILRKFPEGWRIIHDHSS